MIFWKKPEPQEPFKQRQVTRVAYHYDDGTIEVFDVPNPLSNSTSHERTDPMTKLYEVPRNSRIRFTDEGETTELNFSHIDGMYSYNTDDKGNVWHLAAWTEVEVVDEDLYDAAVRADNGGQP